MLDVEQYLTNTRFPPLKRDGVNVLQVNLGYLCNLSCTHCHVNAGPKRTELASKATVDMIVQYLKAKPISMLDITGGAPEMNVHFRYLVNEAKKLGVKVVDRCNLTILNEPGYEDLAEFLAESQVEISASLPCYQEQNVAEQRGKGVFDSSIAALKKLNQLGYGRDDGLVLDLVYNPNGAFLPPDQKALEADYKDHLFSNFGVEFNELLTITNMPISRFGSMLMSKGLWDDYMSLLRQSYSEQNLDGVMCRGLISVDWEGYVFDCDFNQMLSWPMIMPNTSDGTIASDKPRTHLSDILNKDLSGNPIVVGEHCYGCTAGQGSSCGGALS
ncbi:MAG: arsenosugar biosynthesis radical SAM protein ArsS [Agarilytica sp.]